MNVVAYCVCGIVWGTTWFAIRQCIGPDGYSTFLAAALRFSGAGLILLALIAAGRGRPTPKTRKDFVWLVIAGVLGAISYGFVYLSEEQLPGGVAAVIFGTMPLMVSGIARLTRTETITRRMLLGSSLSVVGVALIFVDRLNISREQAVAVAFMLIAVFASSVYSVIFKRFANNHNPLSSTAVFLAVAGIALWVPVAVTGDVAVPSPLWSAPTLWLVYLSLIGSVVVFTSYFYLVKNVNLMTVSTLVFVQPILALLLDAWKETDVRLATSSYLGIIITLCGVVFTVTRSRRPAQTANRT